MGTGPRLSGLYAVTPGGLDTERLLEKVAAALRGGARLLQYRDKSSDARRRAGEAAALLALCRAHGVPLVINDDVALAAHIGADGVHLGRDDGDVAGARAILGPGRLIGVSCYDEPARAEAAARAGADYLAFGSVFPSATKPAAVRAPLALIADARARFGLPVAAIGGITADNAAPVVAAGADLLAVISDLFDAPDVESRAAQFARLFSPHPPPVSR